MEKKILPELFEKFPLGRRRAFIKPSQVRYIGIDTSLYVSLRKRKGEDGQTQYYIDLLTHGQTYIWESIKPPTQSPQSV